MWVCFRIPFGDLGRRPLMRLRGGKLAGDVSLIDCFGWILFLLAALFRDYGVRRIEDQWLSIYSCQQPLSFPQVALWTLFHRMCHLNEWSTEQRGEISIQLMYKQMRRENFSHSFFNCICWDYLTFHGAWSPLSSLPLENCMMLPWVSLRCPYRLVLHRFLLIRILVLFSMLVIC